MRLEENAQFMRFHRKSYGNTVYEVLRYEVSNFIINKNGTLTLNERKCQSHNDN